MSLFLPSMQNTCSFFSILIVCGFPIDAWHFETYYLAMVGFFFTILSALLFGLSPLFTYAITGYGFSVFTSNIVRFGGAGIVILIIMAFDGKLKSVMSIFKDRRMVLDTFLVGATSACTALLLSSSYNYIPSGLSTVLHFTYPIFVTLSYSITGRTKLSFKLILCIILSFVGVVLVTSNISGKTSTLGIVLAVLSACMFASHIFVLNTKSVSKIPVTVLVFWKCVISVMFALTLCLINGFGKPIAMAKPPIWAFVIFPLISALAFYSFTFGTEDVGGPIASIISAFEPITAVVVGILFLGEKSPSLIYVGIALVLAATIIMSFKKSSSEGSPS